jgi:Na+-transporting NADH:ubiquinone oxidoreductase subunit NqrB
MRVTCDAEGFESAWVELTPRFTRAEVMALVEADEADTIAALRERMTGCYIPLNDGTAITEPAMFVADRLEEADILILAWVGQMPATVIGHRRMLGKVSLQLSSGNKGTAMATTMTTKTNVNQTQ